jgi:hypothetical protein
MKVPRVLRAAAKAGVVLAAYLVSTEEERATIRSAFMGGGKDEYVEEYEDDGPTMAQERAAAYLTTGLLTSRRALHNAHQEGVNCGPYHDALHSLLADSMEEADTALRVVEHLIEIAAPRVSEDDIQRMVANIVATEASGEDDDDEDDDFFL